MFLTAFLAKMSLPVRERGLKPLEVTIQEIEEKVAPRAGAWIETSVTFDVFLPEWVAPRAGAWIETGFLVQLHLFHLSLPVRERGLKLFQILIAFSAFKSLPVRERGLKHQNFQCIHESGECRSPCGSVD